MSNYLKNILSQYEQSGKLRYRDLNLQEVTQLFSPHTVIQSEDETYIIHPLPHEGNSAIQLPCAFPVNQANIPIIPITYTISHDLVIQSLLHLPADQHFFVLFGHLTELEFSGPILPGVPHFRLYVDHHDIKHADAVQVIVPRRLISPTWLGTKEPPIPMPDTALSFHRHIISPIEYHEIWLLRYDDTLKHARKKFRNKYCRYLINSL